MGAQGRATDATKCPRRKQGKPDGASSPPSVKKAPRWSSSSSPAGNSASFCMEETTNPKDGIGHCEPSLSTTLEAGGELICTREAGVVVLDTGATANLACFRWLNHYNPMLGRAGLPCVSTHPAQARFKFGGDRPGAARFAEDIPAGAAGAKGNFTGFVLGADIPASLRQGASEALGGQLDFC